LSNAESADVGLDIGAFRAYFNEACVLGGYFLSTCW
jgi:hypothetical protein